MLALACLAGVILVGWGAVSGPLSVSMGTDRTGTTVGTSSTQAPSTGDRPQPERDRAKQPHRTGHPWWLRYLERGLAGLAGLVALGVLVLLGSLVRRLPHRLALLWRYRSVRREHDAAPAPAPVASGADGTDALADTLAADRAQQLAAVDRGSPRNGIVAAWNRLEQIADHCGLPPHDWETSAEFTARMLHGLAVDETAATGLAELYRKARFSSHPVEEEDRERARAALTRLHDQLRSLA